MLHWTSVRDPNRAKALLVSDTLRLRQEFLERLPVVFVPAGEQVLRVAVGKATVIEGEFGPGAAFGEFEFHDRVGAGVPVFGAPGLYDSLVGNELDLAADDDAAERGEGAAGIAADLCWWCSCGHHRFHGVAEFDD